ncbi:hypothetical protein AAF712_012928 [Marasmius tenuissimus]|uniref:Uncharacterized protein n=1 Tax=Marasmius tenuissimus TaxID=585030 RepID=A0ABR2ZGG5_9AGAR
MNDPASSDEDTTNELDRIDRLDMELLGGMTALALDADVTVSVRDKNGSTTGSTGTNTSASSMILTNGSPLHTKTIDTE